MLLSNQKVSKKLIVPEYTIPFYWYGLEGCLWVAGYSSGTGTQTKNSDHLYLKAPGTVVSTDTKTYITDALIDLSKYKTLYVDWENLAANVDNNMSLFSITTNKNGDAVTYDAAIEHWNETFSRTVGQLDVSSLNGDYYIKVVAWRLSEIKVYRIWGEK